jgi:hypothetical protein
MARMPRPGDAIVFCIHRLDSRFTSPSSCVNSVSPAGNRRIGNVPRS